MSMLAREMQPVTTRVDIPVDVLAALEWLTGRCLSEGFTIRGALTGDAGLIEVMGAYGQIDPDDTTLIALSAPSFTVSSEIAGLRPAIVYTLARGPLSTVLAPVRPGSYPLSDDLPPGRWAELGYQRTVEQGFLGPGALSLILGERVLRLLGQSNLADRCRIASQRAFESATPMSTVVVRTYRAVER